MVEVKDPHMRETVESAVKYVEGNGAFANLCRNFNRLCQVWHADEFDPDELSLDISDIARHIDDEPWVRNVAALPAYERTWQMNVQVVEDFINKYWTLSKEEITTQMVSDVLRVADPLSRRHILAQRVVIECISELQHVDQLRRINNMMDKLANNPRLEKEYY